MMLSRHHARARIVEPAPPGPGRRSWARPLGLASVLVLLLGLASCEELLPLDTKPLDQAGVRYDSIKQLRALHISRAEVNEIAKVRNAGMSDNDCVALVRIFHQRNKPFTSGDSIAGLYQAGMAEGTVLGLANLNQVGLGSGELQAMHLAGLPDALVLELARHRAAGSSTLSGASLGAMKNLRMENSTLLELVRRGTPDADAALIMGMRRHGVSDAEILRHFPSSLENVVN